MGFSGVASRVTGLFWNVSSIKGGGVFVYTNSSLQLVRGDLLLCVGVKKNTGRRLAKRI